MEIELTKRERRVFDYMLEFGSITSLESFVDLGETRLSGCIWQLRKKGVNISFFCKYSEHGATTLCCTP